MHDAIPIARKSLQAMVVLVASIAIVLAALHLAAEFVTPVLLSMVLALIFWPVYVWLRSRRLGTAPALIVLLGGIVIGAGLLGIVMALSLNALADRLALYTDHLSTELQGVDAVLAGYGLSSAGLANTLSGQQIDSTFRAVVSGLVSAIYQGLIMLLYLLFFLIEGPSLVARLRSALDESDPNPARLAAFGRDVGQYFILRAGVNAVTGAGVTLVLWLLGVDFALLWGVLTFFLSFIPYIGMFLASVPSVLLAWAEYDLARALIVIVALTTVNALAENVVQPALMQKGLSLSPTFVILSVFFWGWLLGGGGSFLAVPLSLGLLTILANYPGAHWFVRVVTTKSSEPAEVT